MPQKMEKVREFMWQMGLEPPTDMDDMRVTDFPMGMSANTRDILVTASGERV